MGDLRGTLQDERARPLVGARVFVYDQDGRRHGVTETDSTGRWALNGLPGERYDLKITRNGRSRWVWDWLVQPAEDDQAPIAIVPGTPSGLRAASRAKRVS